MMPKRPTLGGKSIRIPENVHRDLKVLASKNGVTIQVQTILALEAYLAAQPRSLQQKPQSAA